MTNPTAFDNLLDAWADADDARQARMMDAICRELGIDPENSDGSFTEWAEDLTDEQADRVAAA